MRWPALGVFGVFGEDAQNVRNRLRALVGDGVLLLETAWRPEGPIAVEDPRHGALRLLPDHGVYFEFVPVAEANHPRPTRHTLDQMERGVPYELALTSPAGLWACRLGLTVRLFPPDPRRRAAAQRLSPAEAQKAEGLLRRPPALVTHREVGANRELRLRAGERVPYGVVERLHVRDRCIMVLADAQIFDAVAEIDRNGYVVLERAIEPELVDVKVPEGRN